MLIAVSSFGTSLDAWVGVPFGKCSQFLVVDTETMDFVVISIPPEQQDPTKISLFAIRAIANQGAQTVITGHIKDICKQTMINLGIEVIDGVKRMTVRDAIELYATGGPQAIESYEPPPEKIAVASHGAALDATLAPKDEPCTSFVLVSPETMSFEIVQVEPADTLLQASINAVRATGAKILVSTCASCYHTWKYLYPEMLPDFPDDLEVLHATEYMARLIERGQLKLGAVERVVTYHDPCDLGKKSGIFDEPRYVLENIPGIELREMVNNRQNSLCCGGGGNVEAFSPDTVTEASGHRLRQAQATGAQYIISACQQCMRTLFNGARQHKIRVRAVDISQIVLEAVENAGE
jgi:predicted Fe-Mo cluster-binding NifX family protein